MQGLRIAIEERDVDALRKRDKRSQSARIVIPEIQDPARRERCLADPELFLKTYLAKRYYRPFGKHHYKMIETIYSKAKHGGRQAIAAPRGCGKSELVKGMLLFLVLAELVRFPVPVASTTPLASRLYADFRNAIQSNDLLLEDFPEICHPVRALEGAPQRASRQHVDGHLTNIKWTATDYLSFPYVPDSPYGGVKMAYYGLDSAFRGINIEGDRPDFILIDDPETRESSKSLMQIEDRESIIDQDIAGLGGEDSQIAIVVLTTVQNRYCLSYRLTDSKQKPAWNGLRYGMIEKWPDRMDLWEEYIAKRRLGQENGDEHAVDAVEFYLANRDEMDAGAELLTEHFTPEVLDDGTQLTYSVLQVCFNKIADTSMAAFKTEFQNDPEEEEAIEKSALTIGRVMRCTSGYDQGVLPEQELRCSVLGIDIGKYKSHWTKISFDDAATGWITDYGFIETHGLSRTSSEKAIENALIEALEQFADSDVIVNNPPLLALVDSGDFTPAIYEVCHRLGRPFYPVKGDPRFRLPKANAENVPFLEAYARKQFDDRKRPMWLYHVNSEYWKEWVQERFLIDSFVDGVRVPGSLALFEPPHNDVKFHAQFGRHMVSEGAELVPTPNKEHKRVWIVRDPKNNHWLDATAYACAAGGCVGIRVVQPKVSLAEQVAKTPARRRQVPQFVAPGGQPFLATERR